MTNKRAGWRADEVLLLKLTAEGRANKEIAADLGVSVTTIKKRLARLMRRLDVENRVVLVRAAIAAGLIDP